MLLHVTLAVVEVTLVSSGLAFKVRVLAVYLPITQFVYVTRDLAHWLPKQNVNSQLTPNDCLWLFWGKGRSAGCVSWQKIELSYTAITRCHSASIFEIESHLTLITIIVIPSQWCLNSWWTKCIHMQVSYYSHFQIKWKLKSVTCMRLYFNIFMNLTSDIHIMWKILSGFTLSMYCFFNNLSSEVTKV